MWDDSERAIAAKLIENKEVMDFLHKVYCPDRSVLRKQMEANVLLDDKVYGGLMRSLSLAEKHYEVQHANIKLIAERKQTISSPIAPK